MDKSGILSPAQGEPVDKVRKSILDRIITVKQTEAVALANSLGRTLSDDVICPFNVPANDNSAMDGYAFFIDDVNRAILPLQVIGTIYAGRPWTGSIPTQNQCVRIMTGGVMPAHCNTVVAQEFVQATGDQVTVPIGQSPGQNRRFAGEDLAVGKPAIVAGEKMGPAEMGLVASLGIAHVTVYRRVRVAFFSSGDEILSLGEAPRDGCIYDSNRFTLIGMLSRLGVELIDMGVIADNPQALEAAVKYAAANADVVISSGGVSVGAADHTRAIMQKLGEITFWQIAMRPGRPMAFGKVDDAFYFGLPGNPVAVMITFYFFVKDALERMGGGTHCDLQTVGALTRQAIRKRPGRTEYQRGRAGLNENGQLSVSLTGQQGSGVLSSMAQANCIVILEHDQSSVEIGDEVKIVLFEGLT